MNSHTPQARSATTSPRAAELWQLTKSQLIERILSLESAPEYQCSQQSESTSTDVIPFEAVESALQRERNFVSAILETVGALVIVLDREGRVVRFNRMCEQVTGYTFEEMKGRPIWNILIPPEQRKVVRGVFGELFAGNVRNNNENHWVARDGRRRLIEWSNTILAAPDGEVEYVVGTGIDVTERKQAEEVRREILARYEATFENAAIGIAHIAPDGRYLRVNQKLCEIVGYTREELLVKTFREVIHPADVDGHRLNMEQLLKGQIQSYTIEKRYIRKDGSIVWVNMVRSLMRDVEGNPEYFISCITDITRRKRAEVALLETESRLEAIINQAPIMVFLKDAEGRRVLVNQEYIRSFRISSREEVIGKSDFDLFPPEIAEQLQANDRHVWETGAAITVEEEVTRPAGRRTFLSKKFLLNDSEGKPYALCGISLDVTASKKAADALRESEEHLRRVLDSLFIFVGVLSCDGTLHMANRAPLDGAAIRLEDVQGKKLWDCYWWNYSATVQRQLRSAITLAAKGKPSRYDVDVRMAGGTMMSIDFMIAPMRDTGGEITHLIASAVDITDRRQLEREVLEVSASEQRRIGQDLHDDLCQRLTATEFLAHTLALDLQARKAPEAAKAEKVATYTREAIARTRLLARGLIPVNVTGGGLIAALRELVLKSEELFRIKCQFKCPTPVQITCPETATHLYRIAQECINNAVRHGKATRIEIELETREDRVCLIVTDNGCGISQPLPVTEGMGLRIMQHRAGMIRATLEIRPGGDCGTEVVCTIPYPS